MDIDPKDSQTFFSKLHNMSYSRNYIMVYIVIQQHDWETMCVPSMPREIHSCQMLR